MASVLSLNADAKTVTFDLDIELSKTDAKLLEIYLKSGYTIKEKRKTSAKQKLTKADIEKALESNADALAHFKEIASQKGKNGKGTMYLKAKSMYLKEELKGMKNYSK